MKRIRLVHVLPMVFTLLAPQVATSHGGGLDSQGCHHDRKRGGYHCHRSSYSGSRSSSRRAKPRKMGLTVIPKADIYLNGKRLGTSPVKNIKIPSGASTLAFEVVHPILGRGRVDVDVEQARGKNMHMTW